MSLIYPAYWLLGYLLGSLPFALWITRLVKGVDVRDAGSGHVTTTNTIRQAGWLAGALVLVLDLGKGFLAVWLARQAGLSGWSLALTGSLAVAGHCWPVFAQFRGGMGLATMGGGLIAVSPLAFLLAFGTLILLVLLIRHSARASVVTGLVVPLVLWLFGLRGDVLWLAAFSGLVIAVRFTIDWNRKYRELWLDREKKQ
ncbi:MAG: glycerol-3-phosphate 1-O-acyltransferase [Anaerolineaceae bacterium]|nr:MAG: glycerol-3-phosphate 1-O-acyltransferase [Anaerolineaceae bacterium]